MTLERDKDLQLAERCEAAEKAAQDALAWFSRHPQLVSEKGPAIARSLRKISVRARKLANAARRPMSVAVYGVSQVGKSFMTATMTSPSHKPTRVLVGPAGQHEALDYMTQINPTGGKETTGLVTRFSIRPLEGATAEFPVALRMLREVDVIKIIANTHTHDLKSAWEEGKTPSPARLLEMAAKLVESAPSGTQPGLRSEDVTDLREYVETELPRHPLAKASPSLEVQAEEAERAACEAYWAALEIHAPALSNVQRAEALSPLWGEILEFTDLYLALKSGLDQLGHPEWAFAPKSAILDRAFGVIHVQTLYGLDPDYAAELSGPASASLTTIQILSSANQRQVSLPQPLVTALTRELRLTLEHMPWNFLQHSDILDFPGARSRGKNTSFTELREGAANNTRSTCYLRGKVAVLFDSYVDEMEANSLLLLMSDKPLEVPELPTMVRDWIDKTHGETAEQRRGMSTSMFFIVACADTLFQTKGGMDGFSDAINNRLEENFDNFPGWMEDWTPGNPFCNVYLFRNPSYPAKHIATYAETPEGLRETGYADGFDKIRARFEQDFIGSEKVGRHFAEPAERLNACLELNDGGAKLIAEALAPVCDPDLKYNQIAPALKRLCEQALELIVPYFESDDIQQQIAERQGLIEAAMRLLGARPDRVGLLVNHMQIDSSVLRASYLRHIETHQDTEAEDEVLVSNGVLDEIFGADETEAAKPVLAGFGRTAVSDWRDHLAALAMDGDLARSLSLDTEALTGVVREVLGVGDRAELETRITTYTLEVEAMPRLPQDIAYRVGMGAAEIINSAVYTLKAESDMSTAPIEAPAYPDLPTEPKEINQFRNRFVIGWLRSLHSATALNARDGRGSLIDPEENRKLGIIIDTFSSSSHA